MAVKPKSKPKPAKAKKNRLVIILAAILSLVVVQAVTYVIRKNQANDSQALSLIDRSISDAESRLATNPDNVSFQIDLCQNYLQKIRENADTEYYKKCDDLLNRAISLEPDTADVIGTQASVAYGRHDFVKGLELSQKALSLNPNQVSLYGLVADGQIELGKYVDAVASVQTMVDKRPSLSSFNRVAYLRELYGDIKGAEEALKSATASGSSFPENIAFSQVELGKLYARADLDSAIKMYDEALRTYRDYPPALEALGKAAFAKGYYDTAIKYFDQAFRLLPLSQYASNLSDIYKAQGDSAKSAQQIYLALLAFDQSSAGGVNNDFERAVLLTNHDEDLQIANELANKALIARPSLFSNDALAWNLYKMGKYKEAESYAVEALKFGETIPVVLYHAGMIYDKLGQPEKAKDYMSKAFNLDKYFLESHFSLADRKVAEDTLARLESN